MNTTKETDQVIGDWYFLVTSLEDLEVLARDDWQLERVIRQLLPAEQNPAEIHESLIDAAVTLMEKRLEGMNAQLRILTEIRAEKFGGSSD